MEFHEKLQEMRKKRGMTQEELAQALYVSRTAVSKWESGRGYPGIDSLKGIARFFSVSIDDLLSSEKLIDLAQEENASDRRRRYGLMLGAADLSAAGLAVLPLYPHEAGGAVYAVNLLSYSQASAWLCAAYWVLIALLAVAGAVRMWMTYKDVRKGERLLLWSSMGLGLSALLLFCAAREAYAAPLTALLMTAKWLAVVKMGGK